MPKVLSLPKQPIDLLPDLADSSLVGSWLNRKVQNSGDDYSSAGDDLTAIGAPAAQEVGYSFGGSADYFRRAESDWRIADAQGLIMAWVNPSNVGASELAIFSSGDEGGGSYFVTFRVRTDGKVEFIIDNPSTNAVIGTTAIAQDEWSLVAFESNGSSYKFYINGAEDAVSAGTNDGAWLDAVANRDNITIGSLRRSSTGTYFEGAIKDVRYYSEPKSADWHSKRFAECVPDSSLVFSTVDGIEDLSRYDHALVNYGATVGQMGFSGSSQYIQNTASIGNALGNSCTAITVALWFRNDVIDNDGIFSIGGFAGTNGEFALLISSNAIQMRMDVAAFSETSAYTDTGIFRSLVAVYDGVNGKAYLNGTEIISANYSTALNFAGLKTILGGYYSSGYTFDGDIPIVSVYNVAKSADWAKDDYLRTRKYF